MASEIRKVAESWVSAIRIHTGASQVVAVATHDVLESLAAIDERLEKIERRVGPPNEFGGER